MSERRQCPVFVVVERPDHHCGDDLVSLVHLFEFCLEKSVKSIIYMIKKTLNHCQCYFNRSTANHTPNSGVMIGFLPKACHENFRYTAFWFSRLLPVLKFCVLQACSVDLMFPDVSVSLPFLSGISVHLGIITFFSVRFRFKVQYLRKLKREEILKAKRSRGSAGVPPFLVVKVVIDV